MILEAVPTAAREIVLPRPLNGADKVTTLVFVGIPHWINLLLQITRSHWR